MTVTSQGLLQYSTPSYRYVRRVSSSRLLCHCPAREMPALLDIKDTSICPSRGPRPLELGWVCTAGSSPAAFVHFAFPYAAAVTFMSPAPSNGQLLLNSHYSSPFPFSLHEY